MSGKYEPLENFLKQQPKSLNAITLSFHEMEKLLRVPLPASAYKHAPWWANQSNFKIRPQAKAWMDAGFKVESFKLDKNSGFVRFHRASIKSTVVERVTDGKKLLGSDDKQTHVVFEMLAQRVFSKKFGKSLAPRKIAGVGKKFDLVSEDLSIIGDAKFYSLVNGFRMPPAKFSTIAEYVWLLEKTSAEKKFIVFGNDYKVPEWWLKKYGLLLSGVSFYFLSPDGSLSLLAGQE